MQSGFEWTDGDLSNIDKPGVFFVHFDQDHDSTQTDFPFVHGNMIHAQWNYIFGQKYAIQLAINNLGTICKIRQMWMTTYTQWKTISIS